MYYNILVYILQYTYVDTSMSAQPCLPSDSIAIESQSSPDGISKNRETSPHKLCPSFRSAGGVTTGGGGGGEETNGGSSGEDSNCPR